MTVDVAALRGALAAALDPAARPDAPFALLEHLAAARGLPSPLTGAAASRAAGVRGAVAGIWDGVAGTTAPTAADVGAAHEWALGARRDADGVFYTPAPLVELVLAEALRGRSAGAGTVLDPACGAGAFLLAVLARRVAEGATPSDAAVGLHGVDVDADAVALCRGLLWLAVGDPDLPADAFDAVVVVGDALTSPLVAPLPPLPAAAVAGWPGVTAASRRVHLVALRDLETAGQLTPARWAAAWRIPPDGRPLAAALDAEAAARPTLAWHETFPTVLADGGFDLVVGNPPYVRGRVHSQAGPRHRRLVGHLHPACRGANWNLFVPFVARAAALGRRSALLVQSSVLGASYVADLHTALAADGRVAALLDLAHAGAFDDAQVHTACVVTRPPSPNPVRTVLEKPGGRRVGALSAADLRRLPAGFWTLPFADLAVAEVRAFLDADRLLGDVVRARDGMEQDQAYALRSLVREAADVPAATPTVQLVTTGAIDPFTTTWGRRPVRFLGTTWTAPVLVLADLAREHPDLHARVREPKVALAGLSHRLEAVADEDGRLLVSKSAMHAAVTDPDVSPHALAAFLNDPATSRLYRAAFGGLGFGGGSVNIRPAALHRLPLPDGELLVPGSALDVAGRAAAATATPPC